MKVSDLIIIYFACGSPLGVYYFTRLPEGASAGSVVWTLLRLLAWPVSAAVLLRARFLDAPPSDEAILDRKISDIRSEMERIAFTGTAAASVFEFRDVFARFIGLARQVKDAPATRSVNELFAISGHENALLASACLARRNRERLIFHQTLARNEFVELVSNICSDEPKATKIMELASNLSELLNDTGISEDLRVLVSGLKPPGAENRNGEQVGEVWIPKAKAASTAN